MLASDIVWIGGLGDVQASVCRSVGISSSLILTRELYRCELCWVLWVWATARRCLHDVVRSPHR